MLNKTNRLTKRKEFGFIHKNGKRIFLNDFTIVFIETKLTNPRFGFVVSKKVGKAVTRNKIKRQLSEIIRLNLNNINKKYNYIFSAKPSIVNLSYQELQDAVVKGLKRERMYSENLNTGEL